MRQIFLKPTLQFLLVIYALLFISAGFCDSESKINQSIDIAIGALNQEFGEVEFRQADAYYTLSGEAAAYSVEAFSKKESSLASATVRVKDDSLSVLSISLGVPIHKNPLVLSEAASIIEYKLGISVKSPQYFIMNDDNSLWAVYNELAVDKKSPVVYEVYSKQISTLSDLEVKESNISEAPAFSADNSLPKVIKFQLVGDIGSSKTSKREIFLVNSCSGSPTHFIASESPDLSGGQWLDYSAKPSFVLSAGIGKKIVYFKIKNSQGESGIKKATISLVAPSVKKIQINQKGSTFYDSEIVIYNVCEGTPTYYIASENADFSQSEWKVYSNAPAFILSSGLGKRTIYFKVKNDVGESKVKKVSVKIIPPAIKFYKINNGDSTLFSTSVTLNNISLGNPTEYMASESKFFENASWQPYSITPIFMLTNNLGKKTVFFKVRNENGESSIKSNSAVLNKPIDIAKCKGDYVGNFQTKVKTNGMVVGRVELNCVLHIDGLEKISGENKYLISGYLYSAGEIESNGKDYDVSNTDYFNGQLIGTLEKNYIKFSYTSSSNPHYKYTIEGKIFEDKTTGSIDYNTDYGFKGKDGFSWQKVN